MRPRVTILAIVLTIAATQLRAACPGFSLFGAKATGDGPWFAAAGDFNKDGRSDIVTANANAGTISVLLGNGDRTFADRVDYAVGPLPMDVAIADLNGDTKPDLAVSYAYGVAVLLNNGDGTFAPAVSYKFLASSQIESVAAGDFDKDGDIDLVGLQNGVGAFLLTNNGNGTFADGPTYAVDIGAEATVVVADFNADAKADLAISNGSSKTISILLGNGSGGFAAPVPYAVAATPTELAAGDVNGDGRVDLVSAHTAGGFSLLLGNGDGTFGAAVQSHTGDIVSAVSIADVTGDGFPDVAAAGEFVQSILVYPGNGSGVFGAPISTIVGGGIPAPDGLAVTDVDGDGKLDLISANYNADSISVLLNRCTTVATVDSLTPATGSTTGGTSVVLAGLNLGGATSVTFDGSPATITNNTTSSITVSTPAHALGTVDVLVTTPAGAVLLPSAYTYLQPPVITSLSPSSGRTSSTQVVVITGTDLAGATAVSFGGTAGSVTSSGATTANVVRPAHAAGVVDVVLTTPAGSATLANGYTYVPAPTAATITPSSGPLAGGQSVTIGGTNLANVTSVTFGGTAATITNNTATSVTVETPAHAAGSVTASVITAGGTANAGYSYVVAPSPTSVTPGSVATTGGTTVTIGGTALSNSAVVFDGLSATISSNNSTSIVCVAPAHTAGTVSITITTPGGTATTPITYVAPPVVSSVTPAGGPTAGGQTGVSITGTGLASATGVTFGGTSATITANTATNITVTTPAHAAGAVTVSVTTAVGSGSLFLSYQYATTPSLTSITPNAGPAAGGQGVVLGGANLANATSVTFDGIAAAITNDTASSIAVTTPPHAAGTANVIATTPGGTASRSYTYVAAPSLTSITPGAGPAAGGQGVVLFGADLANATSVTFDGIAAAITNDTSSSLRVTTPPHAAGAVSVVVITPGGTTSRSYTYVAAPSLTSITPGAGPAAGGQGVVLGGADLANVTSVTFDGVAAAITNDTASSIAVTTPPHAAGAVSVVVITPGGTASRSYTYVAAPSLTSITPGAGPAAGGQGVILFGADLANATSVTFDGIAAAITNNTSSSLRVTTPPHAAGAVSVVVITPGGTASRSYTYVAAPSLTSITPGAGPAAGGQGVVLGGADLANATSVTFDGIAAAITNDTASSIAVTAPPHAAGAANVIVTTPGGTVSGSYTYVTGPSITSIDPNAGPTAGGESVVLGGTGLSSASSVTFDGIAATIGNNTSASITVTAPPHAEGAAEVVVTTAGGSATTSYTYVGTPLFTSIAPIAGPASGGQSVVVSGNNLSGASGVTFDGVAATITNNTPTAVTVMTPPHAAGTIEVVVTTTGGIVTTIYGYFAAPSLTSILPDAGPVAGGERVVLGGSDLSATISVTFDGISTAVTGNTPSSVEVTTPAHAAGAVSVVVTTPGGSAMTSYAYIAAPSLVSMAPGTGPAAGGQSVVLAGSNLSNAVVTFGGITSLITNNTDSSITVTTPPHAAGPVGVVVTTAGGSVMGSYTYIAAPSLLSMAPSAGPPAGGQSVVVGGSNLSNAVVTFGGIDSLITNNTDSSITLTTPPHAAGPVGVVVTTAGGSVMGSYTYIAAPSLLSMAPSTGPAAGGQSVVLEGSSLPNAVVTFGGIDSLITNNTDTSLTLSTPPHAAGPVDVVVATAGGSVRTSYTYIAPPSLTSILPSTGPAAGGQSVVLSGSDLSGASSVTVGGVAATITNNAPSAITLITPPHAAGTAGIVVTTAGGIATTSYTYVAAPEVTGVSPNHGSTGGGQSLTIHGSGLDANPHITLGGVVATPVSSAAERLEILTPSHAPGEADLVITTDGGSFTAPAAFLYVAPPTAQTLAPLSGPAGGEQTVTIGGSALAGATFVTFGGIAATITGNTDTSITVITPPHPAGAVDIVVVTPEGTTTLSAAYTYLADLPTGVPVLSTWMLLLLSLMLTAAGVLKVRSD